MFGISLNVCSTCTYIFSFNVGISYFMIDAFSLKIVLNTPKTDTTAPQLIINVGTSRQGDTGKPWA